MRCAYSAGVLDRFLDDHVSFDYCIGVSAGSANLASFLAGRRDRNRRFYTEHIRNPEYFGLPVWLKTGDLFNLDYIYSTLSNEGGGDPIGYESMQANPTQYVITCTSAETGRAAYFDGHSMERNDYSMIKASCAMPAACRPRVVRGEKYYDGGVADSIPVRKAFEDGCERVVVLLSRGRDFVKEPEGERLAYHVLCRKYPNLVASLDRRHENYNESRAEVFRREREGSCFVFAPSAETPISTYTMDAEANQALYDLGVLDYNREREKLSRFLQGSCENREEKK